MYVYQRIIARVLTSREVFISGVTCNYVRKSFARRGITRWTRSEGARVCSFSINQRLIKIEADASEACM